MAQKKRRGGSPGERQRKVEPFRLRVEIVAACHLREVTPKEIADIEGLKRATAQYYFGALTKEGWIHVSRKERVGGGVRYWYRADRLNLITDREFEKMNDEERQETSHGVLMHYLGICGSALREGTLDARPDSHLSHTPMGLDSLAWQDLQSEMDRWLERSLEIKVEAEMRLRKTGEEPIPTVVHLGGFEIPASVIEDAMTQPEPHP